MSYQVILPKSVRKELDRLPDEIAGKFWRAWRHWKPIRARQT